MQPADPDADQPRHRGRDGPAAPAAGGDAIGGACERRLAITSFRDFATTRAWNHGSEGELTRGSAKLLDMRTLLHYAVILIAAVTNAAAQTSPKATSLFDGKTLRGWEGDTVRTWRVEDGAIAGGSLTDTVPRNEFLTTTRSYGNFILRLKFKLAGTEKFINSGVQFRSRRTATPPNEMIGYQADLGEGYWGSLYDESRRNRILAQADAKEVKGALRPNEWNDYEIRAEGPRIRLFLNGRQTVDYTEPDAAIPQSGLIGLQIHGGGKAKVFFKDITIEELR